MFTLPTTLTSIGNNAFQDCQNLAGTLHIPSGVTYLGNYAFSDCYHFTGLLNIPASIGTIGSYVFESCYNLGVLSFRKGLLPLAHMLLCIVMD